MKNSGKRNVAFLLAIFVFIHGLPVQPMEVYAQNEPEVYFEINLTDNTSVLSDATVEVKFLEEWIALTYDSNGEVYKGSCKCEGETVSGNLIEGKYEIRVSVEGYKEIQKDISFTINGENHLIGSFDIKGFKILDEQNKFMLKGNVKDTEGNPLSGVKVTIKSPQENVTYAPIMTGEDGSYKTEIAGGFLYIFTLEKEGYESISEMFTVSDSDMDIEHQKMEKIETYELVISVTGEEYGDFDVSILSENTTPEKINEHTYKCKKGDIIKISAFPNANGFLSEETEKQMISEKAGGNEVDDGSSYYYVTEPMNESKEFKLVFEPAVYGLVRYEEGKVTYVRNGERGKIDLNGNTWTILPDKENHYYVKNCIRSNEADVSEAGQNIYQFSGMGSGSFKVEYEKDEILSQITLSGNGISQEDDRWIWFLNVGADKGIDIFLKNSQRKLDWLKLYIKDEIIEADKSEDIEGTYYCQSIGYELLKNCHKVYVRGEYQDACSDPACKYCTINEEISIIEDNVPPVVESISINNEETATFEQDGITYINADQAVIDAIISDNYNIKEIYYKCYKEKKNPEDIKAEYENGGLHSFIVKNENISKIKEENNKITFKINCTIDTSEAATGVWYLYIVAKDYAGNIDFNGEGSESYPFILGKDTEAPTVSINDIGENKNNTNFKKQEDAISLEGIFKDEQTSDGLEYYVTEPIRISSDQYDPKVWGKLEENVKWIQLGKNANDQTGNRNTKTKKLYISDGHTVSDNGSISGNGLDEGSYIVWLYAKDGCGNVSNGVSYVFHIDNRAPSLNYLGFGEKEEGKYFSFGNFFRNKNNNKNNKRIISIEAIGRDEKEVSYYEFDKENRSLKSIKPEIEEIKLIYRKDDNASINKGSMNQNNALWESKDFIAPKSIQATDNGNKYIFDFEIPEEAVFYSLYAVAKDKAGNFGECDLQTGKNYASNLVMWDQTSPYLSESFKPQQSADYKKWYRADSVITYQFETGDKESGLNGIVLKVNGNGLDDDLGLIASNCIEMKKELFLTLLIQIKEADATISYNITDDKNGKREIQCAGNTGITIAPDGHVTISCEATDNAGNSLEPKTKESTIYIDQDKPVLTGITFTSKNNRIRDNLAVVPEQYGYFFKQRTEVTVYATDFIGTSQNEGSGVGAFVYYFKHSNGAKTTPREVSATKGQDGTYSANFSIPENFKGQLFVKAIDRTGQEGDYKTPRGIIIDNGKEHKQHSKAEIVLPETSYKDGEGNPLYSYLPVIEFKTADGKSGIKENAWSVKPFHLSENEADGVLQVSSVYEKAEKAFVPQLNGDTDWKLPGNLDVNLITAANKKYQIKNQMNHVEAKLKLTDNAGNSLKETISVFSVDTTNPEIQVEYSNNDVLHEKYYKEPRTATITITERNFSEEGVELLITGDGVKKGEWQHHAEGGCNGTVHTDSCTYTCDVVFDEDGEYTLGVNCTDLAGNKGTYGQTDEFVIDLTAPVVVVTYDNNNAKNGSYYKEGRVGTIDIEEVNFDEEEAIVTVTAKRQTEAIEVPVVSAFTKSEYHNRATVSYEQDGDYTFDIKVTDLAGNEAEIFTPEEFTIDTTPPELLVEGVKDGSANKGVVAPVITYEDINLEEDSVSISLTGANLGEVKYEQKITKTENGKKISLGDFKHKKEVDDLYTLKTVVQDLAGNETIDEKTFSVNRFGSVYILDDSTRELIEGFYSNKERDLVITEINVDSLQFQEIVASVDGEMTTLKEGRDFEVKAGTSDSSWKTYEYHIGAGNFKEEGAYVVTIYSEDRAENKSSNKAKGKELEFIIDKTAPSIVVAGIEDGGQYNQVSREITLDVQDNILLENVDVYVDGKVISTTGQDELLENNGIVKLSLKGADRKQSLTVISRDAAGNQAVSQELSFLITKNLFVQWYSNKALFYGSIIGVAAIIMLIFWLWKRRDSKIKEA